MTRSTSFQIAHQDTDGTLASRIHSSAIPTPTHHSNRASSTTSVPGSALTDGSVRAIHKNNYKAECGQRAAHPRSKARMDRPCVWMNPAEVERAGPGPVVVARIWRAKALGIARSSFLWLGSRVSLGRRLQDRQRRASPPAQRSRQTEHLATHPRAGLPTPRGINSPPGAESAPGKTVVDLVVTRQCSRQHPRALRFNPAPSRRSALPRRLAPGTRLGVPGIGKAAAPCLVGKAPG